MDSSSRFLFPEPSQPGFTSVDGKGRRSEVSFNLQTSSCLFLHHFVLILGSLAPVRRASYRYHLSLLALSALVGTSCTLDSVLSVGGEWLLKGDLALLLVHRLHFDALIMYNAMMTIFLLVYLIAAAC